MKNTINFLGLASVGLLGFTHFPVNAQIPQTEIQSVVLGGEFNEISQQINQYLNLNFVYFPQVQQSVISIPNLNIQQTFLDNPNNQFIQEKNQNFLEFPLRETSLVSFDLNDFLNNDNTLTGKQFITQEVFVEGNSNIITQKSSQTLTDFFWLDESSGITEDDNLLQFLDKLLASQALDSLQFGLQDTFVFGNDNQVSQLIDQTFESFIFTPYDFDSWFNNNLTNQDIGLDPVQFTVQNTSIIEDSLTPVSQNNLISQTLNQVISGISFINPTTLSQNQGFVDPNNNLLAGANSSVNFDINDFIDGILKNTNIEVTQKNQQSITISGDQNTSTQENEQVSAVSVPEPSIVSMMVVLGIMIGIEWFYEKN
ncbi:hypothetical protein [Crocosphaera chwakensis]|uniref:PEP-CTERM sorting domain-containing protein n=1 Tax=Crocosphaera chwakensis CCY0110 TaxID=391612 RepID=A3IP97_9CHRO|nr:hypothetical protein [Crocosphaera chwakensis]EAZ91662.1 hypothetical protein CY0110_26063 [Crocosphaera chwakensis CCY0110]